MLLQNFHFLRPQFIASKSKNLSMVIKRMTNVSTGTAAPAQHKPLINLLRGWPNPSLLPAELLRVSANTVLQDASISVPALLYGPDWGDQRLREQLAKWLTQFYKHTKDPIDVERLTITGGASQNLGCILQTFTDPEYTRNVWVVAPSYFLAFRIFDDSGFSSKLRSVPEDEEGLNIDYLRREITASEKAAQAKGNSKPAYKAPTKWGKTYKHIIYAVPTYSNPSSKTMSLERREELVRLAREFDALIVTDDVYDQLQWHATTEETTTSHTAVQEAILPRLVDIDRYLDGGALHEGADGFGNTASNGSFSKIVAPGIRTGWVEGTQKLAYGVSQTGTSRSGGAPSHIAATFLAEGLATGGIQEHIYNTLQPAYARRWRIMMRAIEEHLVPLGIELPQTSRDVVGGYFIWLKMPPRIKASLLSRRVKDTENVVIAEGKLFEVPGDATVNAWEDEEVPGLHEPTSSDTQRREAAPTAFPSDIRLCFAWEEEELLEEGIARLAQVVKEMLGESEGLNPTVSRQSAGDAGGKEGDQSTFW